MNQQHAAWEKVSIEEQEVDALSMGNAAQFLGISLTALNNRAKRLGLTKYQLGSKRYLVHTDIEKLRQAHKVV